MGNQLFHLAAASGIIEAMEIMYNANPNCINERNSSGERAITYQIQFQLVLSLGLELR